MLLRITRKTFSFDIDSSPEKRGYGARRPTGRVRFLLCLRQTNRSEVAQGVSVDVLQGQVGKNGTSLFASPPRRSYVQGKFSCSTFYPLLKPSLGTAASIGMAARKQIRWRSMALRVSETQTPNLVQQNKDN